MSTRSNQVSCAAATARWRANELPRLQGKARSVRGPRAHQHRDAGSSASPRRLSRVHGQLRVPGPPEAAGQALVRLRHRAAGVPGEAAPAPQLSRLESARLYFVTPDAEPDALFA